jgi:hypothetical protein
MTTVSCSVLPGAVNGRPSAVSHRPVAQFGRRAHALVGADRTTFTFLTRTSVRIEGTAHFPEGTVEFGGIARGTPSTATITIPVTGGTGSYAHARGTVTAGTAATNVKTYRLTLP